MSNNQNLKSWQKGASGNPAGRPRGTKNWGSIVRDVLESEEFFDNLKKDRFFELSELIPYKNASKAIATAIAIKACSGDVRAAEWLRKTAYGDKTEDGESEVPVALVSFFDNLSEESLRRLSNGEAMEDVLVKPVGATIVFEENPSPED